MSKYSFPTDIHIDFRKIEELAATFDMHSRYKDAPFEDVLSLVRTYTPLSNGNVTLGATIMRRLLAEIERLQANQKG